MIRQLTSADEMLQRLESLYTIEGLAAVRRFVAPVPFLVPLLLEAQEAINSHFPQAVLGLRLEVDPEVPSAEKLLATIAPASPPTEAADQFDRFLETWWIDAEDRAEGMLVILVEYR